MRHIFRHILAGRGGVSPYTLTAMLTKSLHRILAAAGILFTASLTAPSSQAQQEAALKTNLFYDATATINAGAEMQVAPKWSVDLSANFNGWTMGNDKRWKHWMIQPEARYWFCEALGGNFVAAHLLGGQYNFGNLDLPFKFLGTDYRDLRDHRYQGWYGGIGFAYGHAWMLDRHWNLEAEIGLGWVYATYDKYPCATCGRKEESGHHNYIGPTKAAINLVYVF